MKKLFLLTALFVAAAFPSCSKHDGVETPDWPEPQPLAIAFVEGNSLQFDTDETKTVHYTITGGSDKTVVTAELQTADDAYAVETTPTSATEGTITITAKAPETENCIIVTVSDGSQSVTAEIAIALKASFDGKTIVVETPGTLWSLLADYDSTTITELTVIGNLNDADIATLKWLPNLAILDMENVNLEKLPFVAFCDNTSLTFVKLPLTLKTIGNSAFSNCSNLTSITIPNSVTTIGERAFEDCRGLTSVTIGNSVTTIESYAFSSCNRLAGVYITDIAKWCAIEFEDNANPLSYAHNLYLNGELVTDLVIPDSVTEIRSLTFYGCSSLTSVTIPDGVTTIESDTFRGCSSLASITIPDGVTTIGSWAFSSCSGLTSITIPDGVTSIGSGAFSSCSGLTSVTIPDSVTSIGDSAFFNCRNLTSITIPDGVTLIGDYAFFKCRNLTSIYCKAIVPPSTGNYTFNSVNATATLYVPTGCKAAYAAAAGWKDFKTIKETQF